MRREYTVTHEFVARICGLDRTQIFHRGAVFFWDEDQDGALAVFEADHSLFEIDRGTLSANSRTGPRRKRDNLNTETENLGTETAIPDS